jgi:hypothetical protein
MIRDHQVLEALQTQLESLESMRLEHLGNDNPPAICVECYSQKELCSCPFPLYWPLPAALHKLRAELAPNP